MWRWGSRCRCGGRRTGINYTRQLSYVSVIIVGRLWLSVRVSHYFAFHSYEVSSCFSHFCISLLAYFLSYDYYLRLLIVYYFHLSHTEVIIFYHHAKEHLLSAHLPTYLITYIHTYIPVYLSIYLSIYLPVDLPIPALSPPVLGRDSTGRSHSKHHNVIR